MGQLDEYIDNWLVHGDEDWDEDAAPREVKCRDCGSEDVYWSNSNGKWVLYGINSRKHVCDPNVLRDIRIDAFD